jgi:hypothetical protein
MFPDALSRSIFRLCVGGVLLIVAWLHGNGQGQIRAEPRRDDTAQALHETRAQHSVERRRLVMLAEHACRETLSLRARCRP